MSSKIYFSNKSGKGLSWYIINSFVKTLYLVAPAWTEKQTRRLLLKPHNRPVQASPAAIQQSSIHTEYGDIAIYQIGDIEKPKILFTHGWSGSSAQFYELMQATAKQGYHCIAFDHYAHHQSKGKECNFPLFVIALNSVIKQLQLENKIHCVVSHSMGVAGTVNVFHGKDTPHFFIAPFFDFWNELSNRILGAGIPEKLFKKIIKHIESDYEITISSLEPDLHMQKIKAPIYIAHDPQDKFALYKFSKKYDKQQNNITLKAIPNTGHMRIIKAKETQAMLSELLNSI